MKTLKPMAAALCASREDSSVAQSNDALECVSGKIECVADDCVRHEYGSRTVNNRPRSAAA